MPQRKAVGALLLGGVAVAILPLALAAAYPAFRVARRVTARLPRPRISLTIGLILTLALVGMAGGALVVLRRLDWRALPLGGPLSAVGFVAAQLGWLALLRGPRGRAVAIGGVAGALALALALRARPDERTVALLTVESRGTKTLVKIARGFFDHDGDGYSTILGGGDCDDHDARIHPGAVDTPDDGIDQNCLDGDAHREAPATQPVTPAAPEFQTGGNVVVIAIDTLRADRLGAAGYTKRGGQSLTPRIDALAASSAYFTHVYSQAPNTFRSFPSIFTSRFPSEIAWDSSIRHGNYMPAIKPETRTVFEVLHDAGIATAAETSHFFFTPDRGITRGVDEWDNSGALDIEPAVTDIAAPRIVPRVVAKLHDLAAAKKPFVLFTHLFEPHEEYVEHPGYPYVETKPYEAREEKYDYEVAFEDGFVGQILDGIKDAGLDGNTTIILLSDHGEGFGDHREGGERLFFHGQTLYDELLRVPLIVHIPGAKPAKIDTQVMLIDVSPTILDVMGVARPPEFKGRSLARAARGETVPSLPAYAELLRAPDWDHEAKAMVDADGVRKIIYRISENLFEMYDLSKDPREQDDVVYERKDARELERQLNAWIESVL
jgi:arylsulfatase A-like enzyme